MTSAMKRAVIDSRHVDVVMRHLEQNYEFFLANRDQVYATPCTGGAPILLGEEARARTRAIKVRVQAEIRDAVGVDVSTESLNRALEICMSRVQRLQAPNAPIEKVEIRGGAVWIRVRCYHCGKLHTHSGPNGNDTTASDALGPRFTGHGGYIVTDPDGVLASWMGEGR